MKISGPILDRIDIHIHVNPVKYQELSSKSESEKSERVRERVVAARDIQIRRFKSKKGIYSNSNLTSKEIKEYCAIGADSENLMKMAITRDSVYQQEHTTGYSKSAVRLQTLPEKKTSDPTYKRSHTIQKPRPPKLDMNF